MITNTVSNSFPAFLSNNSKVIALESTLQQSLLDFKELLTDFEQLHIQFDSYKVQYLEQKEKCESKSCCGAEELKKTIQSKDDIIQLVASTLTKLSETKNLSILDEVFKILFGETTTTSDQNSIKCKETPKIKEELLTPKKELHSCREDLSFRDESVSEIEGTPTGRTSPLLQSKKLKSSMVTATDREKKKCPDSWPTPESKALKLFIPTPTRSKQTSRLRQARLDVVTLKATNVIDITCSPEFSGGSRASKSEVECNVQPLIKKESMENEDTILPSPTSGPANYTLFKSPLKFKKPPLSLKTKTEKTSNIFKKTDPDAENKIIKMEKKPNDNEISKKCKNGIKLNNSETYTQEDSINILHRNRLPKDLLSPVKKEHNDTTYCDTQAVYHMISGVSLLQHVNNLVEIHKEDKPLSPTKRPLVENINITNMADDDELQSSMSLLQRDHKTKLPVENVKRKIVEPVVNLDEDDEPALRTRAAKRLLPGWACRECISFFSELYKDDPDMMLKKINECSHHRGVTNPERPKTPPGYWNPRWNVPEDTEEFNRKNNV